MVDSAVKVIDGGLVIRKYLDKYGESWKLWKIGGEPLESYSCGCNYDCCGCTFGRARSYFGGLFSVGVYSINV